MLSGYYSVMDADGLPLIGPSVDYDKVAPINQKKTVEYLNHFIIHTAGFLNQFSTVCEEKLALLSERIERLHIQMTLLEGKINSIPGLQNLTTKTPTTTTTNQSSEQPTSNTSTTPSQSEDKSHQNKDAPSTELQAKEESVKEQPTMTVSQHPTYVKYFKMLNFGVPMMAVKQKMAAEGLNPDLLDTPSAPMPDGSITTIVAPTAENDDDFSDDEEEEPDEDSDGSASFSD